MKSQELRVKILRRGGVQTPVHKLACLRRNLSTSHGRGFDELPPEILKVFSGAFVSQLSREELMRALGCAIHGLLHEIDGVQELADKVKPQLLELTTEWNG